MYLLVAWLKLSTRVFLVKCTHVTSFYFHPSNFLVLLTEQSPLPSTAACVWSVLILQDIRLAEIIDREGKAALIVVNKWDTVPEKDGQTINTYTEDVRERLTPLPWAPLVFTSAVFGQRVAQ